MFLFSDNAINCVSSKTSNSPLLGSTEEHTFTAHQPHNSELCLSNNATCHIYLQNGSSDKIGPLTSNAEIDEISAKSNEGDEERRNEPYKSETSSQEASTDAAITGNRSEEDSTYAGNEVPISASSDYHHRETAPSAVAQCVNLVANVASMIGNTNWSS